MQLQFKTFIAIKVQKCTHSPKQNNDIKKIYTEHLQEQTDILVFFCTETHEGPEYAITDDEIAC